MNIELSKMQLIHLRNICKKGWGGYSKPIYWMPIPSFDEILEANRDVLERIKEKGD